MHKQISKRDASDDSDYELLDSDHDAPTQRLTKRQRPSSNQPAAEPISRRRTRAMTALATPLTQSDSNSRVGASSALDQCEDAEDVEIDDDFQGPAGEGESEVVPEDDVPDLPLNTEEDQRQEVLRRIAAIHWRDIIAITSLEPAFVFVYYSLDYERDKAGSRKTQTRGYKRRLISTWHQLEKVQKAYCNMILARASQKAHLERRFVGLRRTGYLNSHHVQQDKLQQMLPELAARLDVKVSDLGIVPEEIGVFYGEIFSWKTTLGEERRGSSHSPTLIPSMSLITSFECLSVPNYVLIVDSAAMCNLFGQSQFTTKYLSTLGPGLVVALRGQPTYNERWHLAALSHKYTKTIFAMMIDWDPYSMDIYTTLRRGSPTFLPENPQLALTRLHYIGPKYQDLKSGGAILYDLKDGMANATNLLDDENLPPELEPELTTMKDKALRAQADTYGNIVNLAGRRLRGLIQSNAYFPESGNLGSLHIPVPGHEEDFEFDLDTVVVPAEMDFDKDDKTGRVTLTYTNADGIQTILERCGDAFTISKYANRILKHHVVSTLTLVQQLLEPEREKLVAQIQKLRKEILMEHEATKDRASECFEILEDRATHFQMLIPPPPERIVRPLRPGNVWKKGEPGPEFRALGRAVAYEEYFFGDASDHSLGKMKMKLTPKTCIPSPPSDSAPEKPVRLQTEPLIAAQCDRCDTAFDSKAEFLKHVQTNVKCLQPALPHPASRPSTPSDEDTDEPTEPESLECTVCGKDFDSLKSKDDHLRVEKGWKCVLGLGKPHKINSSTVLYDCCLCSGYILQGIPGLKRHWELFHSESKSKYECEDCLLDYKAKKEYNAHITEGECGAAKLGCFFPGCMHVFPNGNPDWLEKYAIDHYRSHTGFYTTTCPACQKRCQSIGKLKEHYTTDKKTRDVCSKAVREMMGKSS